MIVPARDTATTVLRRDVQIGTTKPKIRAIIGYHLEMMLG